MSGKTRLTAPWRRGGSTASRLPTRMSATTEADDIEAARRGDLRGWELVIRRRQELAFRSAYLVVRDTTLAEEATKTSFRRAYRALASLRPDEDVTSWLMGIVHGVAQATEREGSRRRDAKASDPDHSPRVAAAPIRQSPGTPRLTNEEHDALVEAFDGLSDSDRIIIASHYAFGLGRDGAAARTGTGSASLDGRLAEAMARLRRRALDAHASIARAAARGRPAEPPRETRLVSLLDDHLGSMTMTAYFSQLPWTPDVATTVCTRLHREALAYPEARVAAPLSGAAPAGPGMVPGTVAPPAMSGRRGHFVGARLVATLAGISLVAVTLFAAGGGGSGTGLQLPSDVQGGLDAVLGGFEQGQIRVASEGLSEEPHSLDASSAAAPMVSVVGATRLVGGQLGAVVRIDSSWDTAPEVISRARLERKLEGGPWFAYPWAEDGEPMLATLEDGTAYEFRVRTVAPAAGEIISPVSGVELGVRGARSKRLSLSKGDWIKQRRPAGGRRLMAVAPGARASTSFDGSEVAVVGRVGESSGSLGIRLDGGGWLEESAPLAGSPALRLYRQSFDPGRHTLDIRANQDGLAVEAILILRSSAL